MNSQFEDQNNGTDDMFRAIREMRSPLSMNAVKNYILDHIGEMTLWQKIQRLILQTGAFTVIIGSICCINSPAGETKNGMVIHSADNIPSPAFEDKAEGQITSGTSQTIEMKRSNIHSSSIAGNAINDPIYTNVLTSSNEDVRPITLTPAPKVVLETPFIASKPSELSDLYLQKDNQSTPVRPFAEVQGIAYSGQIRMYGEGFGTGVIHDWQILTLHLMNANGIHDDKKDAPSLTTIGIKKETEQQVSLMFGGIIEKGRIYSSVQVGPSYNMSQITSGIRDVPASNTILSQRFFGVSSQISVGYRITDFLSANIEGLLNYHSAVSGGIMMSVMIEH